MSSNSKKAFILTSHYFDQGQHRLKYFCVDDHGPFTFTINNQKPVFFVEREKDVSFLKGIFQEKEVGLKSFAGKEMKAIYFQTQQDLFNAKDDCSQKGIRTFEADIRPQERFLMERFINGPIEILDEGGEMINPQIRPCDYAPKLSTLSFDIETSLKNDLYSIGYHYKDKNGKEEKFVHMVGDSQSSLDYLTLYKTERELLFHFIESVKNLDPDLILGWHVIGFDLNFLEKKCHEYGMKLALGRDGSEVRINERKGAGWFADIRGRVVLDGPPTLRGAFYQFDDFKLDTVANEVLGEGKDISETGSNKVEEIEYRFHNDKEALAKYNLQDCVLVTDIYEKLNIIELCITRSITSGMRLSRIGSSTSSFDHFYLPRLHRKGRIAPNILDIQRESHAAGGLVFEPVSGLHEHVVVLDFKSLYPSIIRTFKIDPYSRLMSESDFCETPTGQRFSLSENILPKFLEELMGKREIAKKQNDESLSMAIKILMNSFYGVMGSPGCRFYHADLPSAITGTGQWVLTESKKVLESKGYEVVYGDTDSVFVKLKFEDRGNIEKKANLLALELSLHFEKILKSKFGVKSYLEMEYEKHFSKLFLPYGRGMNEGAKKRYAGLIKDKVYFSGMEAVRSDWTKVAKNFQTQLFDRFFKEGEIDDWIKQYIERLKEGEFDHQLIYKKRLSKAPEEYTKTRPPHVKAALMLERPMFGRLKEVSYVVTRRGPIPISLDHKDIDYDHYIDKQIAPLADDVLRIFDKNLNDILLGDQLSLF